MSSLEYELQNITAFAAKLNFISLWRLLDALIVASADLTIQQSHTAQLSQSPDTYK